MTIGLVSYIYGTVCALGPSLIGVQIGSPGLILDQSKGQNFEFCIPVHAWEILSWLALTL